jgi:hypothetical protein
MAKAKQPKRVVVTKEYIDCLLDMEEMLDTIFDGDLAQITLADFKNYAVLHKKFQKADSFIEDYVEKPQPKNGK